MVVVVVVVVTYLLSVHVPTSMLREAVSAMAKRCGGISVRRLPWYLEITVEV